MATEEVTTCDYCKNVCTHRYIEVQLITDDPRLSDDTSLKQYCTALHAELGMDNTGGIPRG